MPGVLFVWFFLFVCFFQCKFSLTKVSISSILSSVLEVLSSVSYILLVRLTSEVPVSKFSFPGSSVWIFFFLLCLEWFSLFHSTICLYCHGFH